MAADDLHEEHHPSGIMRWVTTTNHKDIGTLYLWFSFIMFFIGGVMALIIRSELFQPGMQFVDPQFFNSMTTMHDYGFWCSDAGLYRPCKLVNTNDDWRRRHGTATHE
jgi:hypothetical protein